MLLTLSKLTEVRSALSQEVSAYLDDVAASAAEVPSYYPRHMQSFEAGAEQFDAIRQPVFVTDYKRSVEWQLDNDFRGRTDNKSLERSRPEKSRLPPPTLPWDERAALRFPRAVVLGRAGGGKSWLLRYEARRIARKSASLLLLGLIGLDDVELPILIRLAEIGPAPSGLRDLILRSVGRDHSFHFHNFLDCKIGSKRCVLLLDGWDETNQRLLGHHLHAFARQWPMQRILLTSRIFGYDACPLPNAIEFELKPLSLAAIKTVISTWFAAEPAKAQRLSEMLEQDSGLEELASTPLMLALLCRAFQVGEISAHTGSFELYRRCLFGLLEEWGDLRPGPVGGVLTETTVRHLRDRSRINVQP